jgi:hypothetical protein
MRFASQPPPRYIGSSWPAPDLLARVRREPRSKQRKRLLHWEPYDPEKRRGELHIVVGGVSYG